MALFVCKGDPRWKKGIPKNCKVRVEEVPSRNLVDEQIITGTYAKDLDPGAYEVVITKYLGINAQNRNTGLRWSQRFLHDITMDEFNVLRNMQPTNARAMTVSDGFKLFCKASMCDFSASNRIAFLLHELEDHKGMSRADIVKNAEILLIEEDEKKAEKIEEEAAKRKPGRPRTYNSGTMA